MSVEFSNAYQEVLLENLDAILKQNFMFQARLKLLEKQANVQAELQAKLDELTVRYQDVLGQVDKTEQYKVQADSNEAIVQEKTRIQSALNDTMRKVSGLESSLEAKEKQIADKDAELLDLKTYISKLEENLPATKLKKINTVTPEEVLSIDSAANNLFKIKVEDGSTF
jgi:chromosome segregation ATPase